MAMGQRVLVVDAFATEPLTGEPFVIIPEGSLSETQLQRIGKEFGANGTVSYRDETFHYTGRSLPVGAAVAGAAGLREERILSTEDLQFATEEYPGIEQLSLTEDGSVEVRLVPQSVDQPQLTKDDVAAALGLPVETLRDVGADLPFGRTMTHGGTLFVPVNFLEHLSQATPAPDGLQELCNAADVSRVMAFTFDTLSPESAVHARIFTSDSVASEPTGRSEVLERAAGGIAAGGCGAYLYTHAVFDGEYDQVQVESGHFIDRPARLAVTLDTQPTVVGRGLTVLDGTVVVPDDDDDEIIEAT